jgi:DNA-directed RNA polymerase specialized sigma24 family protein
MDHSFAILAAEHRPMLLVYAKALCYGDAHAAEDVVQETLLVAYRCLAPVEPGISAGRG